MTKTLTLGKVNPSKNTTTLGRKPLPSDADKQAFLDCGFIIEFLYERKIKPKWKRPLSKGIYSDLRALIPHSDLSSKRLNAAVRHHVKSPGYLLLLREGNQRYDLYGKPNGRVSAAESKHALGELYAHHGGLMRDRRKRRNKPITSNRKNYGRNQEHRKK